MHPWCTLASVYAVSDCPSTVEPSSLIGWACILATLTGLAICRYIPCKPRGHHSSMLFFGFSFIKPLSSPHQRRAVLTTSQRSYRSRWGANSPPSTSHTDVLLLPTLRCSIWHLWDGPLATGCIDEEEGTYTRQEQLQKVQKVVSCAERKPGKWKKMSGGNFFVVTGQGGKSNILGTPMFSSYRHTDRRHILFTGGYRSGRAKG